MRRTRVLRRAFLLLLLLVAQRFRLLLPWARLLLLFPASLRTLPRPGSQRRGSQRRGFPRRGFPRRGQRRRGQRPSPGWRGAGPASQPELQRPRSQRQPGRQLLRRRRRGPGGARTVRLPCGRGTGGRVPWPWLPRPEPRLRGLPPRGLPRRLPPRMRLRCPLRQRGLPSSGEPCGGSGPAASAALPQQRRLLAPRHRGRCRWPLQPGHYPYVATLLPLSYRHIRHPWGQIFVNTRRH